MINQAKFPTFKLGYSLQTKSMLQSKFCQHYTEIRDRNHFPPPTPPSGGCRQFQFCNLRGNFPARVDKLPLTACSNSSSRAPQERTDPHIAAHESKVNIIERKAACSRPRKVLNIYKILKSRQCRTGSFPARIHCKFASTNRGMCQ